MKKIKMENIRKRMAAFAMAVVIAAGALVPYCNAAAVSMETESSTEMITEEGTTESVGESSTEPGAEANTESIAEDAAEAVTKAGTESDAEPIIDAHTKTVSEEQTENHTGQETESEKKSGITETEKKESVESESETETTAAGAEEAVTDIAAETYIKEHLNAAYIKDAGALKLASGMVVKQTLVDGSCTGRHATIDGVMNSPGLKADALITQLETVVALYDVDEGSDYYAGYANTMMNDGSADVSDCVFAENNNSGIILSGCFYDRDTGLAYIPKALTTETDGTILVGYVQLQLLQVIGGYEEGEAIQSVATAGTVVEGEAETTVAVENIFEFTTTVEAEAGLNEQTLEVYVNGVPQTDDSYSYCADTGEVVIRQSSAVVGTVSVDGEKDGALAKAAGTLFGGVTAKAADKINPGNTTAVNDDYVISVTDDVKAGKKYSVTADYMYTKNVGYNEVAYLMNGYTTDAQLEELARLIAGSATYSVSASAEVYVPSGYLNFCVKMSTLEFAGEDDADNDDIAFSELSDDIIVALKCAHVSTPIVAKGGTEVWHEDGNYTSVTGGNLVIRILYRGEDANGQSYMLVGLVTQVTNTQTGIGIVRLNIESGGYGKLRIRKLYDNLEKVKAINARYAEEGKESPYSRSRALYGVYTSRAYAKSGGTEGRVGRIRTSKYGWSNKVLLLEAGTYYVRELTRSKSGVFLNESVVKVEIEEDKVTTLDDNSSAQFVEPTDTGWGLKKVSGDTTITTSNPNYSLAGAEYTVYTEYTDDTNNTVAAYNAGDAIKLVTDANGDSNEVWVSLSDNFMYENIDLWVKETKASPGYQLDPTVHKIKINNGNLWIDGEKQDVESGGPFTFTSTEQPKVYEGTDLTLKKVSDYPLTTKTTAGAIFKVVHTAGTEMRTWYFRSKESDSGNPSESVIEFSEAYLADDMDNDIIYTDDDGNLVFPLGTLTITEYQAPSGYKASNEMITAVITDAGDPTRASITVDGNTDIEYELTVENEIIFGGVKVRKVDSDVWACDEGTYPQGDGSLDGAVFAIYNINEYAVVTSRDKATAIEPGEEVCRIVSSEGIARTDQISVSEGINTVVKEFLQGASRYRIAELDPCTGYLLNDGYEAEFMLPDVENYIYGNKEDEIMKLTCENEIKHGDVRLVKVDAETGKSEATGGNSHGADPDAAVLSGISFEIRNVSEHPIFLYGNVNQRVDNTEGNNLCMTIVSRWSEAEHAYIAETTGGALPYGTYTLTEVETNDSYLLGGYSFEFEIREEGILVLNDKEGDVLSFPNYVKRQDISFNKIAQGSNRRLQTAWLVTNNATGEAHVIVTDANGNYDSATANNPHSNNTNANDALISYDIIPVGEMDLSAGTWFGEGEDGTMAPVDDELRALPYGKYTMAELRSESNEGYDLVEISFRVGGRDSNDYTDVFGGIDLGTITDSSEPKITTRAADKETGDKLATVGETTVIVDTVHCTGLDAGETYTLRAQIRDYTDESSALMSGGRVIRAQKEFVATGTSMDVEVEIAFDAAESAGKIGVVFEELYKGAVKVAEHADIDDESQRIYIPGIGTAAADGSTGNSSGANGSSVVIVDTVEYKGLITGREYTVRGAVYDKETGKAVSGEAEHNFTPETSEGTVSLRFEFAADSEGKDFVVFEKLYYGDTAIASHEDLEDEGQTVHYPKVGTEAKYGTTGLDEAPTDGKVTIIDTVSYKNLVQGMEYTVSGVLMDKSTGETLKIEDKEVTGEAAFVPDTAEGSVSVEFSFDASSLAGKTVVVFEEVYCGGVRVASHKDLEDAGQTVKFPNIVTKARDGATQSNESNAAESVTIIDKVSYSNLTAGNTYTVSGVLMDKSTGEALMADGKTVTAEKQFTAETADGEIELEFTFNGSELAGKTVVVYENLYREEKLVAVHADINNAAQSISMVEGVVETEETETTGNKSVQTLAGKTQGNASAYAAKTQDAAHIMLWLIVSAAMLAVCAGAVAIGMRHKKKNS